MQNNRKYNIKNSSSFLVILFVHLFYYSIFPITLYFFITTLKSQQDGITSDVTIGIGIMIGIIISFFLFLLELSLSSKYNKYSYLTPKYIRIMNYLFTIPIFIFGFLTPSLLYYLNIDLFNVYLIIDILLGSCIICFCLIHFIRGLKSIIKNGETNETQYHYPKTSFNLLVDDKDYIECKKRFTICFVFNVFLFIILEKIDYLPWLVIIVSIIYGIFSFGYTQFLFKTKYKVKYLKYLISVGIIYIIGMVFLSLTLFDVIVIPLMDKNDIVIVPSLVACLFLSPYQAIFLTRNQQKSSEESDNNI
jgi:hypothetical protein